MCAGRLQRSYMWRARALILCIARKASSVHSDMEIYSYICQSAADLQPKIASCGDAGYNSGYKWPDLVTIDCCIDRWATAETETDASQSNRIQNDGGMELTVYRAARRHKRCTGLLA